MSVSKNFQYLLILFFGALVLVGGFIWIAKTGDIKEEVQTPGTEADSDVSDWKSFKNEQYGFEMKFPENWSDGPNLIRPFPPHRVFCPPEFSDVNPERGCKWESQPSGAITSSAVVFLFVEDWNTLKGDTKEEKKGINWCKIERVEKINGQDAQFVDCGGKKRAYWENPLGTRLFKLFLMDTAYQKEFDQMLSAFRFLE